MWVKGQTLCLANLLSHEPSVVLNGAQSMSGVDVVDLDGLVPSRTTSHQRRRRMGFTHVQSIHGLKRAYSLGHTQVPRPNVSIGTAGEE